MGSGSTVASTAAHHYNQGVAQAATGHHQQLQQAFAALAHLDPYTSSYLAAAAAGQSAPNGNAAATSATTPAYAYVSQNY